MKEFLITLTILLANVVVRGASDEEDDQLNLQRRFHEVELEQPDEDKNEPNTEENKPKRGLDILDENELLERTQDTGELTKLQKFWRTRNTESADRNDEESESLDKVLHDTPVVIMDGNTNKKSKQHFYSLLKKLKDLNNDEVVTGMANEEENEGIQDSAYNKEADSADAETSDLQNFIASILQTKPNKKERNDFAIEDAIQSLPQYLQYKDGSSFTNMKKKRRPSNRAVKAAKNFNKQSYFKSPKTQLNFEQLFEKNGMLVLTPPVASDERDLKTLLNKVLLYKLSQTNGRDKRPTFTSKELKRLHAITQAINEKYEPKPFLLIE